VIEEQPKSKISSERFGNIGINERLSYVELWLSKYAPEEFQWRAKKDLPAAAQQLTQEQKTFLQN
jgi:lysyl-tRNA synthetase class I